MAGRRATRTLTALLFLMACADPPAGGGDPATRVEASPRGRLVIVGGALQAGNSAVYQAILEGRRGDGPLCVVPTASADAEAAMTSASTTFATYVDSSAVLGILIPSDDPGRARDPSVAAEIASCSGFFFTGGVQTRVVDTFLPDGDTTAAFRALMGRWRDGAVVSGSSAGAAMMSGVMIAGGGSAESVANGVTREEEADGVAITRGMGFFQRAILDQHFLSRGRIGRLVVSVLATDSLPLGLGIDENTALVVDGDSAWVAGASGVVVVDGRNARRSGLYRGDGIRVTLAGAGDVVDLGTFVVRHGPGKERVPVGDGALDLPADPFARWAFLHLLVGMASTGQAEASFTTSGAVLRITEGEGFSAVMAGPQGGVEGTPAGFSAGPFLVALTEAGP